MRRLVPSNLRQRNGMRIALYTFWSLRGISLSRCQWFHDDHKGNFQSDFFFHKEYTKAAQRAQSIVNV
jgi:hypothetical protein